MAWYWCLLWCLLSLIAAAGLVILSADIEGDGAAIITMCLGMAMVVFSAVVWFWYSPHPGAPCTHSHQETSYILVHPSKYVSYMQPITYNVCDKWGPKK